MVVFRAPTVNAALPDRDRYSQLVTAVAAMRERVVANLKRSQLDNEAELPDPTAFHILPARATPQAIEVIKHSPDVVDVQALGNLPVDLAS